jgi:predicted O-methyltransferase YrrM
MVPGRVLTRFWVTVAAVKAGSGVVGRESGVLAGRVAGVRRRLAAEGPGWERGPGDFATVTLPARDCDAVCALLVAERARTVVEIGLAYGSSALAIGHALASVAGARPVHVIIDPLQATEWSNVGWQLLCQAGLDSIATLVRQPSSLALAGLVTDGFRADAAFVDGSHRFHEVFVDLYYLRQVVHPGGLIILDDCHWPPVATAVHYYETNMAWRPIQPPYAAGTVDSATGHRRLRAFRLPDPPPEPDFHNFTPF